LNPDTILFASSQAGFPANAGFPDALGVTALVVCCTHPTAGILDAGSGSQLIYKNTPVILIRKVKCISHPTNPKQVPAWVENQLHQEALNVTRTFLLIAFAIAIIAVPAAAGAVSNVSGQPTVNVPDIVQIGIYVVDFNRVDVGAGTVGVDFYLNLKSDTPVSINDFELMNGMITSVSTVKDTPLEKEYRIIAVLTAEPDLSHYPFDRHMLPIRIEPKIKNEREMVLATDPENSGLDPEADLPGWTLTGTGSSVTNKSYVTDEVPFSRAVFTYGVVRDATSTILKFFLPIMLIIIVSLTSLMMRISSRLGLNASMFLAAVLIHWRVADAIPLVAYATFLDLFMIITYATLVMVLISGILVLKFTEAKNTARVEQVNYWSIRIIPVVSIIAYFLLFLTLMK
jgi:hypothetical protein